MKRLTKLFVVISMMVVGAEGAVAQAGAGAPPSAVQAPSTGPIGKAVDNGKAPMLAFDVDIEPLKLPPRMNFGETLGIAIDSKGRIVVLNHPGTAKSGPIFGNATTQLLEFSPDGTYVGEIGEGVYGFAYGHSIRFDKNDNLWYVDKASNSVIEFNPQWRVIMNLGRRDEGYDSALHLDRPTQAEAKPRGSYFNGPTDVAFDPEGDIFVGDGYVNSRIVKFDKNGDLLAEWGNFGSGGAQANENPGKINNPHNIQADRQGNIYIADRANRRIQVFDKNGKFIKFLFLNAPYDKTHKVTLGITPRPENRPDQTQPWTICISNTTPQYLFAIDIDPGRLYKMTLDGKIVGIAGNMAGRQPGQFNWAHAIACPSENVVWVADMNNWRIQKFTLKAPVR